MSLAFDRRWVILGILLAVPVGIASGLASALFLIALDIVTSWFGTYPWLLWLLPVVGAATAWAYSTIGKSAARGNNAILDQIHDADEAGTVPLRMFPMILITTLATHLVGGSAGREGTAVQMGGAIAASLARLFRVGPEHLRVMLMCGVSGGFGSIFGTPLAGTVFAMEVLTLGGMRYDALIPCLVAALLGDLTVQLIGVEHTPYAITSPLPELGITPILVVALAGILFGLTSTAFSEGMLYLERWSKRLVTNPILRGAAGGLAVIALTLLFGTRIYNGLSLPLLAAPFDGEAVPTFAFALKLLLTVVTLSFGFRGGEVTPLFVIGATLGATLAAPLGMPVDVLAALGFVAVFAAAANTPIACVLMGAELFGAESILWMGIAVFVAYAVSGDRGIYHAQRVVAPKRAVAAPLNAARKALHR